MLNGGPDGDRALAIVTRTDIGKLVCAQRGCRCGESNHGWIVLADGMGGYRGGDVAARIVVKEISAAREQAAGVAGEGDSISEVLCEAVRSANRAILREACCRPSLSGMGSTVVAAAIDGRELVLAHVGDSRAYCFADGVLEQLTRDHSLLQERIDEGMISAAEAQSAPGRNLLTGRWVSIPGGRGRLRHPLAGQGWAVPAVLRWTHRHGR